MPELVFLSEKNRERFLRIISPLVSLLARLGVHPNIISISGLALSLAAGIIYSTGSFFWAAWVLVAAGTCDVLDGMLARQTEKESLFGAFFDSTFDRYGETAVFLGLAWYFSGGTVLFSSRVVCQSPVTVLFIILAASGSFMVSYTRARAEGLGVECKVGWMQRPERVTLLIIGSLLGSIPGVGTILMSLTLFLLALLSNITAIQRILHVRRQLADWVAAP